MPRQLKPMQHLMISVHKGFAHVRRKWEYADFRLYRGICFKRLTKISKGFIKS